jgi:hypothetical protein
VAAVVVAAPMHVLNRRSTWAATELTALPGDVTLDAGMHAACTLSDFYPSYLLQRLLVHAAAVCALQARQPRITRAEGTHALILVPTRELAVQVRQRQLLIRQAGRRQLSHELCNMSTHCCMKPV